MRCTAYLFICRVQEYAECIRAGAEEDRLSGSTCSAYLFAVEQGNELIGDAELPPFECGRYHGVNRFKLFRRISPQVDLGRLDIRMAQPQGHLADIPGGLQHQHGAGVSQDGPNLAKGDFLAKESRSEAKIGEESGRYAYEHAQNGARNGRKVRIMRRLRSFEHA